ncbi:thialysine N-epsilon-acetyltransferase isoform X1 [Teleopsis dalmanni]|uniref:thialysine N-epsilon-acetyltransferase isoform X1 n=1 Tax=Teleopsis dalmanni TaxID=139649 RepID=UPI0018CEB8AC|nr:thialysine N-epsilon-acetyltransferase isoform X1 [Teleopsis dalmanni]
MEEHKFIFRRAEIDDMKPVREMIQELADFEEMSDGPELTEEDLIRDSGLSGGKEYCHIYILELEKGVNKSETIPIGYSICFFAFSMFQSIRTYFLEDLYVRPQYRGIGAGAYLFRKIASKAKEYNSDSMDFHVLAWNPARKFYQKMGAINSTETKDLHFYRLTEPQIEALARKL